MRCLDTHSTVMGAYGFRGSLRILACLSGKTLSNLFVDGIRHVTEIKVIRDALERGLVKESKKNHPVQKCKVAFSSFHYVQHVQFTHASSYRSWCFQATRGVTIRAGGSTSEKNSTSWSPEDLFASLYQKFT
jgi:hypothetical protein